MSSDDPIEALAVGVAADHKAAKQTRGKGKGKGAQDVAAQAGDEAAAEAQDAGSPTDEAEALGTVVEEKVAEAVETGGGDPAETPSAEPTPAAPGDDPESVFDRRLARLTALVDEAEFDSGTAFGDLRDCVIDLFKHRPKLWSAMPPSERQDLIRHVDGVVKQLLDKIVLVIAQEDSVTVQATLLSAFAVKGESIEAKIKVDHVDKDALGDLYALAGQRVVVIDAASKRFMSARRDQNPGSDQTEMSFADPAPQAPRQITSAPPPAPVGDTDLADGADQSPVEEADDAEEVDDTATEGDAWGVFDTDRSEWLIDEAGGDDGWTSNSADAGRWPYDDAKRLAADFADGGEGVVARQLGDDSAPAAEPQPDNVED